jgi:25S rRNA (uracil2634-N3)-methyltransferase
MVKQKKRRCHDDAKLPAKPQIARAAHKTKPQRIHKHTKAKALPPTIPFQPEDRILLIGEGDFSFAKSIVNEHGCCDVTATCLDSKEELFEKYKPQGEEHVAYLEEEGQTVLYGVNAMKLDKSKTLKKSLSDGQFDVVMFNFPHVGGKSTDVNRQVRFNQELLVEFFKGIQLFLAQGGTIVVTLFEGEPYTLWNVRDLARHAGLEVQRSFKFLAEAYPGYSHARTLGNIEGGGGWKGEDREARSYVFQLKGVSGKVQTKPPQKREGTGEKRKRTGDDSGEDE